MPYSRGSFRIDDEGTPAQRTVLVEDGMLVGYLWDLLNARLTRQAPDRQRPPRVVPRRTAVPHDQHVHRGRRRTRPTR